MKWCIIILLLFSSCKTLDFPDNVHEEIENQGPTVMSKDINFAGNVYYDIIIYP